MAARRSASAVSSPACGRELAEFLDRVAQPVGFALGALDLGAMRVGRGFARRAAPPTARPTSAASASEPAVGIEQAAMGAGIDQRAVVVLAVDLDQRRAELLAAPARSPAGR